jgi:DNA-binding transcriptional LysR family regulator
MHNRLCPLFLKVKSMFDEMRALVALEETGSFVRAAQRLSLTPSAATRMVRRLEDGLGTVLLDRSVKPAVLTVAGRSVLQQCKDVLRRVDLMAASVNPKSEPSGIFRLGLSHALADDRIVASTRGLRERYPAVQLRLLSDLTAKLFERLKAGELDAALVLMPQGHEPPAPLVFRELSRDKMNVVAGAKLRISSRCSVSDLSSYTWILNPPGCLMRAALMQHLEQNGVKAEVAAEVHNIHLQASLVASGQGLGLLPSQIVKARLHKTTLTTLRPGGFELLLRVCFVRAGQLGKQEAAAKFLEEALRRSHATTRAA